MDLLLIVLPAFLIFTAGFIGQKLLKLNIKSISTMSLYLMLPFLTFDTFYSNELNIEYFYMFLFTVLFMLVLLVITLVAGKVMKGDKSHISSMLLGTLFPNSGNYGAPVALFAFGAVGFQYAVDFNGYSWIFKYYAWNFYRFFGSEKSTTIKDAL